MFSNIRQLLKRFWREKEAIAAVEFALILPTMLLLYIGSSEASRLFIMDRKLAVVAGSMGDLVARVDGSLATSTLNDFFAAAAFTMKPYPTGGLKQVITSVLVKNNGRGEVQWSRGYNGGSAHARRAQISLPSDLANRYKNKYLIVGEAEMQWTPIMNFVYTSGFKLEKTYYYRPRYDAAVTIK